MPEKWIEDVVANSTRANQIRNLCDEMIRISSTWVTMPYLNSDDIRKIFDEAMRTWDSLTAK